MERSLGVVTGRDGPTVTFRRESKGIVTTTRIDTTSGVFVSKNIARPDGSSIEVTDEYYLVEAGVLARTSKVHSAS